MKQFFKFMFASMFGFGLLIFLFFVIVGIGVSSAGKEKATEIKANSILSLDFSQPIPERTDKNPFANINFGSMEPTKVMGLNDILKNIKKASEDDDIKGIYLDLSTTSSGLATLEQVRNALIDFKASGKFIVAYGERISQSSYYLATVADEIYINPEGFLDFRGFGTRLAYFSNMMEKLDIDIQIFAKGKFKSAIEPFKQDSMSASNREQMESLLGDVYQHFLKGIAKARGKEASNLHELANNMMIQDTRDAKDFGLVDGLKYYDEVLALLKEKTGTEEDKKLEVVKLGKYDGVEGKEKELSKNKIGVIYATGSIVDGKGEDDNIGSERFAKQIRDLREDDKVKAIVLRVNSGGGSALASDVILREAELAKAEKPFVVSFGDVAASGGYYISCGAERIFAETNSVTGSIGVFGMVPNLEGFYKNKLGITFDEVETAEYATFGAGFTELNEKETAMIEKSIDSTYSTFKRKVAEGRGMTMEQVQEVAQGRVWTGKQALEVGLIDEIGSLDDAIAFAAEKAELEEDYRVSEYPKAKDPMEEIMKEIMGGAKIDIAKVGDQIGLDPQYLKMVEEVKEMKGIQARMPYHLEFY